MNSSHTSEVRVSNPGRIIEIRDLTPRVWHSYYIGFSRYADAAQATGAAFQEMLNYWKITEHIDVKPKPPMHYTGQYYLPGFEPK